MRHLPARPVSLPSRLVSVVLATLLVILGSGPLAPTPPAGARPLHAEAPLPDPDPRFLRIDITAVDPQAPTGAHTTVTVRGTIRNVSTLPIGDIELRLQRGAAVARPIELRTSLTLDESRYGTATPFVTIAAELAPGASQPFSLTVPLGRDGPRGLRIDKAGVYPLLVNANANVDHGPTAHLADARFLLPVLGVAGTTPPTGTGITPTPTPLPLTMIWPVTTEHRRLPGSIGTRVRLPDDDLVHELEPGGRLAQLLATAAPSDTPRPGMCLSVDPELVETVSAVADQRLVARPPGPGEAPATGADDDSRFDAHPGSAAARAWLESLHRIAAAGCVLAMPWAGASPDAVASLPPRLQELAVRTARLRLGMILGTPPRADIVVTPDGGLGARGAELLRRQAGPGNDTTVLVDDLALTVDPSTPPRTRVDLGDRLFALPTEAAVTAAFAAAGADPTTPTHIPDTWRFHLASSARPARAQDALGALAYRALAHRGTGGAASADGGRAVIAPPASWIPSTTEIIQVGALLDALDEARLTVAAELDVAPGGRTAPGSVAATTGPDLTRDIGHMTAEAGSTAAFLEALAVPPAGEPGATALLEPLDRDLLVALRAPLDDSRRATARATTLAGVDTMQAHLQDAITLLPPGGAYTLASESSPVLLVARNSLPLPVRVRLDVPGDQATGREPYQGEETVLPARGSRTLQLPASVTGGSEQVSLSIGLALPDGTAVGRRADITVHAGGYGTATLVLTVLAGSALFFLAGRRLWHRYRGESDPADEDQELR